MSWMPDYCTLAELKAYQRLATNDVVDDVILATAITAASRAIDKFTLRQFGQEAAAAVRHYEPIRSQGNFRRGTRWIVEIDDLMTTSGLLVETIDGTTISSDHYRLWPRNAAAAQIPYTHIEFDSTFSGANWYYFAGIGGFADSNELTITAQWGWSSVPQAIKQATLMQANRWEARRDSPFGVAGSPETGSELRLLSKLDADVMVAVRPYYRWWGAY
jgi:hypothetical protein